MKRFVIVYDKSAFTLGAVMAAENSKGPGTTCILHTENRIEARADNGNLRTRKISQEEQPLRQF